MKNLEDCAYFKTIAINNQQQKVLLVGELKDSDAVIQLNSLDTIDYGRLLNIIDDNSHLQLPLWKLLTLSTLSNGMNALEYFHQLVKIVNKNKIQKFKNNNEKYDFIMKGLKNV